MENIAPANAPKVTILDNVVTGHGLNRFGLLGDSGALVFTNTEPNHRVLSGIMDAGDEYGQYSLITLMEYVYKDIKEPTGTSDVRFRL